MLNKDFYDEEQKQELAKIFDKTFEESSTNIQQYYKTTTEVKK